MLEHSSTLLSQLAELERKTKPPAVVEAVKPVKYKKPQAEIPLSKDQLDTKLQKQLIFTFFEKLLLNPDLKEDLTT